MPCNVTVGYQRFGGQLVPFFRVKWLVLWKGANT